MLYASKSLLLLKILKYTKLWIQIYVTAFLIYIMKQIEVKIIHAAFFKLLLKGCSRIIALGCLMSRIFGSKKETLTRIF